jgi:hypothetical protein
VPGRSSGVSRIRHSRQRHLHEGPSERPGSDVDLKKAFYIGAGLGVVGMIFMFPPFFTLFKG